MLTQVVLKQGVFIGAIEFRDANFLAKVAKRLGAKAPTAQASNGWQARVVPAINDFSLDKLEQFPLGHHRIGQVQTIKFDLLRMVHAKCSQEPIVQWAMVFKFEGANRIGHAFDAVLKAMRPIVHRVDIPGVAGAMMRRVDDAIHHWIAQLEVVGREVDFGTQDMAAWLEGTIAHGTKQREVLRRRMRSRSGDGVPGVVAVPRVARISSTERVST